MHTLRLSSLPVAIALTLGLLSCASPPAQEPLSPEAMARMMALGQPGPEHAELAKYAGQWQGDISIFSPMDPDAPPMRQTAPATCSVVLDGRFLQMQSSGDFMGQPIESLGLIGFDRRNEVWTTVGFDSLGTYWVSGAGTREDDGVIRMYGRDVEPLGAQEYFFELEFVSDDEFVSSVCFSKQGPMTFDPPFKMVETRYTRK